MGQEIRGTEYTRADRARYRVAVQRCLEVLGQMLADGEFAEEVWRTGLEIELNLVDNRLDPAMVNAAVLEHIADPRYQTELGRFTIELNVEPGRIDSAQLVDLEQSLRANLNRARDRACDLGTDIVMVGILPTVTPDVLHGDWISANPRYAALNEAIMAARREDLELDITGPEPLYLAVDTIAPEAACTSVQLHLQITPDLFAPYWNAATALAGPQLALGANSPFLFEHRLWAETRIELFLQATDTRSPELRNQGVRPRVWFGERWITSIFDLFEENVRYFPALLPEVSDEDPVAVRAAGGTPSLAELRLHNGTIYRWNRPVYDVADGAPHLRVENRVLPAGPSVLDVMANAAFFYGTVVELVDDDRPVWSRMTFEAAESNFRLAARRGVETIFYWPGFGQVTWDELVLRHLLPLAHAGLDRLGVQPTVRDRYLGVIEARAKFRRNGAWWQAEAVRRLERPTALRRGLGRDDALHEMLRLYMAGMHANVPVHEWDLP